MNSQYKTNYKTLTDAQLIACLKFSDHSAFAEIYSRYYHLMINFAYRKLHDEDLTKDFVQELFTNVWQRRETMLESGNLRSYLYISLRSNILNHFHHQNVETKYIDYLRHDLKTARYNQTDYRARERSMNEFIEKQIMALPKKMRTVFQLSRKEYLSHKQIAEKLNTTENNVSTHITSALKFLKAKLTSWIF